MLVFQLIQQSGNMGTTAACARVHAPRQPPDAARRGRHLDEGPEDPQQPAAAAGARYAPRARHSRLLTHTHAHPAVATPNRSTSASSRSSSASSSRRSRAWPAATARCTCCTSWSRAERSRAAPGAPPVPRLFERNAAAPWCAADVACGCVPAGTPGMSTTASSSPCCARSATSTSSAKSAPRLVRCARHHIATHHAFLRCARTLTRPRLHAPQT